MKLIKGSSEFLGETPTSRLRLLKSLERIGRICYKSEDSITDTSAPEFCEKKFGVGHFSIFDHSNAVFVMESHLAKAFHLALMPFHRRAGYHNYVFSDNGDYCYVNGNLRAWEESLRLLLEANRKRNIGVAEVVVNELTQFLSEYIPEIFKFDITGLDTSIRHSSVRILEHTIPTELKMYSSLWITDRSVTHEKVRHRPCAFMQESQRYVTYKSGLTCIIPPLVSLPEGDYDFFDDNFPGIDIRFNGSNLIEDIPEMNDNEREWLISCISDELIYRNLLKDEKNNPNGWPAQHARDVLPNSCKTEIMTTADLYEWRHIFNMRCAPTAHPKIRKHATDTLEQFAGVGEIAQSGILAEQFKKYLG